MADNNTMQMRFKPEEILLKVNEIGVNLEHLKERVERHEDKTERIMESLAEEVRGLENCVRDFKSLYRQDKARVEAAMWTSGKFWALITGAIGLGYTLSKVL